MIILCNIFFQPTDPRSRCHRLVALILMCLLGFGSYFCMDNPAALQVCEYSFQSEYKCTKIKVIMIFINNYLWLNKKTDTLLSLQDN